jgi:ABC-2 type transport system ATP-binding protein
VTAIVERIAGHTPVVDEGSRSVTAPAEGGVGAIARLADALEEAGIAVEDLGLRQPTLDDAFLTLTGVSPETEPIADETRAKEVA